MAYTFRVAARNDIGMRYHCRIICMDFYTSTFGVHPGSIDVRVRFVWMIWTLFSKIVYTPVNHTQVCIKMVVCGTVHVNSCIVRCKHRDGLSYFCFRTCSTFVADRLMCRNVLTLWKQNYKLKNQKSEVKWILNHLLLYRCYQETRVNGYCFNDANVPLCSDPNNIILTVQWVQGEGGAIELWFRSGKSNKVWKHP